MIKELRNILEQRRGKKIQIENDIENLRVKIKESKQSLHRHEQAKEIIKEVGLQTQKQLQFHISDITSLALDSVFENSYELHVEFVERREKTECDLLFKREDTLIEPLDASGYGAIDVASFALRIASWTMQTPRTRPIIILDEPFKFLSIDKQEQASEMIRQLSRKLGLQFIIVTHEQVLTQYADKIFETKIRKGITKI